MRKSSLFVIALLFMAPAAFAQVKHSVSAFFNGAGVGTTRSGDRNWYAEYGLGYDAAFTPHWSAAISVGSEHHSSRGYVVDETGFINEVPSVSFRTNPIDLTGRFHFVNETRWKPYIGAGARYVAAPHVDSMFGYTNRWTPEAVGGVVFQLKHLGILAEAKVLAGDHEYYDSAVKTSLGLSWRF